MEEDVGQKEGYQKGETHKGARFNWKGQSPN